jgi:hypothetical protein
MKADIDLPVPSDDEKHRLILIGLADVEAGRTIPHAEVARWVALLPERRDASTILPKSGKA